MAYGWQENENGQMVYRDSRSGELLKGWQTLDGQTCWFDADGVLAEGAAQADGKWYLFGFYEDGTQGLLTGYQTIKTGTYSADKNGVLQTGWQNWRYFSEEEETYGQELPVSYEGNYWYRAGDKRYYFKDNKTLLKGWQKIGGRWYYFDQTTGAEDSTALPKETYWAEAAGELYYFKNGTGLAKGWQTIGGRRYYFDANGVLQTGFFTVGKDSYYGAEKMAAYPGAVVSGMQTIDGAEYYFNAKGVLQIGFQKINGNWSYFSTAADSPKRGQKQKLTVRRNGDFYWYNADGETYCLKKDTTLLKGWQTINSQKYYFDAKTGELQTGDGDGLYVLNGKTYYLGADGALRSGVIYGNAGQVYTADKNGVLQSGWQKLDGVWCYFDKQTKAQDLDAYMADDYFAYAVENGVSNTYYFTKGTKLATGWQTIDGARYYFAKDGVMQRGKTQIGSAWYYFEADGEMGTGFRKIGGFTYYFDANGKMATGSQKIDGETYYFNKQGVLMPEKLEGWQTEDGKAYFYKNGEPVTGWQTLTVNGVKGKYYFDKESGVAWTGARQLSGKWYYFIPEQQGRMASNETITDGDGTRRYYAADGTRQTGWKKIDGSWRYFLADGSECQVTVGSDGWVTVQLSDTETMQVYIRKNSAVLTGWQTIDKQRYYFEPGSGAIYTGHRQIGTSWYYFDETTGQMQTGYCADADGVYYYYNAKGVAQTGFQKITKTGDWKFFDPESAIPGAEKAVQRSEQQDGRTLYVWYTVGAERYCMKNDTTLLKGRQKLAGQTYWFHQTTGKLYTGFFAIGQDRYLSHEDGTVYTGLGPASKASTENDAYYDANGKMLTGWITIKDGEHPGKYYFNKLTGTSYRGGCYLVDGKEYLFDAYGCVKTDPVLESVKSNNYRTAEAKWKEEPAAVSYVLQWSKDKTFTEEELIHEQTYESSVLSALATNLEVGSTYYFRVKYQLAGKNGALIDSNWSAVKSVKIMGGVAPTYTSAEIKGLDVTGVTSADGTVETQLHLDFAVNGWLQSYDETYYLVRVDSYADSILSSTDSPLYSIPMEMGTAGENGYTYSVDLTVPDEYAAENENVGDYFSRLVKTSEVVMGKYALAIKTDEDQYQRVSKGAYVSDPAQVAENDTAYYVPASKKGIQDAGSVYRGDMGTKHTLQNMRLGNLLKEEAGWDTLTWNYKGKEYYFDQDTINAMAGTVSEYNNEGISVSLVLLLDFPKDSAFQYLVRIGAQKKGAAPYYMMETTTQKAQETWEAIFSYLGFRFGQDSCFVSNWILGNEVNSCNAWNYKGGVSYNEYVKGYASAFRMLYYGVKMTRPSSRVFISLDNAWCKAVAGFAGKKVLDSFAADIAAENPNIEWNVAFHAYSAPLTRVGFWTDYSNTTNSVNSPFISMRNLDQLTNYLGSVESKYGKDSGSIRVILSEQGWTSSSSAGEHGQGEALARAYYIAEFNDRVDAFIIRAEVDAKEEVRNGLSMGLRYQNDTKKMAYYVYKYMDTPVVSNPDANSAQKALKDYDASKLWFSSEAHREKFAKAQQLLVEEIDWKSEIPGYDAAKLNQMPYAAAE